MEASVNFLLRWKGVIAEDNSEWVRKYLDLYNTYIQPGISFEDLNALKFGILKSEKTSRKKTRCELPLNMPMDDSDEDLEVIMVTRKE